MARCDSGVLLLDAVAYACVSYRMALKLEQTLDSSAAILSGCFGLSGCVVNSDNRMKIELLLGDITKISCDAIVNAANTSLLGGGGVDGAIHRAGGPRILQECREIRARSGGCETGQAVFTSAGRLPAKYVIHTVGPVWQGGTAGEEVLLRSCYENSINLADTLKCGSVAFPNISTGVYGFPKERAAQIVADLFEQDFEVTHVDRVLFVVFDEENYALYKTNFARKLT